MKLTSKSNILALRRRMDALHNHHHYRWYVLLTVFAGTFMAPLDSSIVNIAMPEFASFFNVNIHIVEWVATAYLLTASSLLLSAGRLADLKGQKRLYVIGFIIFTIASALCGLSQTIDQLILFRILQAIGATCLLATGAAILTAAFPLSERGKVFGMLSISISVALMIGPVLGGFIVHNLGWRWIFYVNIPVGIIVVILATSILEESDKDEHQRFDIAGALLAFIALLALLFALSMGQEWGWTSVRTLGLLAVSVIAGVSFIVCERTVDAPMLDLSLFSNRLFAAANMSALISYIGMFIVTFLMPFYYHNVFGLSLQQTGFLMTPVPLMIAVTAPISGSLSDRMGSRWLSSAGLAIVALALFGLSKTSPAAGVIPVVLLLGLEGLGSGMFQSPNTSAVMSAVPKNRLGIANGMQAMMRNLGMVLGIAVAGAIVSSFAPETADTAQFANAIRFAFLVGSGIVLIGVIASFIRGNEQSRKL